MPGKKSAKDKLEKSHSKKIHTKGQYEEALFVTPFITEPEIYHNQKTNNNKIINILHNQASL